MKGFARGLVFKQRQVKEPVFVRPCCRFHAPFCHAGGSGKEGDSVTVIALHSTASGPTTGRGQHVVFLCKSVF